MLKNIGLTTNISKLPEENIQPNAVDLCIDRVWEIGNDEFYIGIDKKQQEGLLFLQSIQDANLSTQSSLIGNKKTGMYKNKK